MLSSGAVEGGLGRRCVKRTHKHQAAVFSSPRALAAEGRDALGRAIGPWGGGVGPSMGVYVKSDSIHQHCPRQDRAEHSHAITIFAARRVDATINNAGVVKFRNAANSIRPAARLR